MVVETFENQNQPIYYYAYSTPTKRKNFIDYLYKLGNAACAHAYSIGIGHYLGVAAKLYMGSNNFFVCSGLFWLEISGVETQYLGCYQF